MKARYNLFIQCCWKGLKPPGERGFNTNSNQTAAVHNTLARLFAELLVIKKLQAALICINNVRMYIIFTTTQTHAYTSMRKTVKRSGIEVDGVKAIVKTLTYKITCSALKGNKC